MPRFFSQLNKHLLWLKLGCAIAVVVIVFLLVPEMAHAGGPLQTVVGWLSGTIQKTVSTIINFAIWLMGSLVLVAGLFLDLAIEIAVVKFPNYVTSDGVFFLAWTMIRDLANMAFIFVLLYIAISTMLQAGGSPTKLIVNVVIAAVLINFSWAITRVVVDVSNVAAAEFYSAIVENGKRNHSTYGNLTSKALSAMGFASGERALAITASVIEALKVDKLIDPRAPSPNGVAGMVATTVGDIAGKPIAILIAGFLNMFVLLAVVVILFAGGFLLLFRALVLILMLIVSPLAFLSFALPGSLSGTWGKWLDKLLNQAFFAPVFLLALLIVLRILTDGNLTTAFGNGGQGLGGFEAIVFSMMWSVFVLGLLASCVVAAKSMGAIGADQALKLGRTATAFTTGKAKTAFKNTSDYLEKKGYGNPQKWATKKGEAALARVGGIPLVGGNLERTLRNAPQTAQDAMGDVASQMGAGGMILTETERKAQEKADKEYEEEQKIGKTNSTLNQHATDANIDLAEIARLRTSGNIAQADEMQRRRDYARAETTKAMGNLSSKQRQKVSADSYKANKAAAATLSADELKKMRDEIEGKDYREVLQAKITGTQEGDANHEKNIKGAASVLNENDLTSLDLGTIRAVGKGLDETQTATVLNRTDWGDGAAGAAARQDFINKNLGAGAAAKMGTGDLLKERETGTPGTSYRYIDHLNTSQLLAIINNKDSAFRGTDKTALAEAITKHYEANIRGKLTAIPHGTPIPHGTLEPTEQKLHDYLTTKTNRDFWGINPAWRPV